MERAYEVGTYSRVFYGLAASLMLIFCLLLVITVRPHDYAILFVPAIPILICIVSLFNLFTSKVIITHNTIRRIRLFYDKELRLADIKGCRIGQKVIVLESKTASSLNIRISNYHDLSGSEELAAWIQKSFVDLNKQDLEKNESEILMDTELGATEAERKAKADRIKEFGIAYVIWGVILGLTSVFVDNKIALVLMGIAYPLLAFVLFKFSYGLLVFVTTNQNSASFGIAIGFLAPAGAMLVSTMSKFEMLTVANALLPAMVLGLVIATFFYLSGINKPEPKAGQIALMILAGFVYAFGGILMINCRFDESAPKTYQTTVTDEYISNGKGPHYHIRLKPWVADGGYQEIDVSESTYEAKPIGTPVVVSQKAGALGIPWFYTDL